MKPSLIPILLGLGADFQASASEAAAQLPPVDPAGVVTSVTYDLGGRYLTVEEVTQAVLPDYVGEAVSAVPLKSAAHPRTSAISPSSISMIQATSVTYHGVSIASRSLVVFSGGGGGPVEFWSSADWRLLAAMNTFQTGDNRTSTLLLMQSEVKLDDKPDRSVPGPEFSAPAADGTEGAGSTFVVTRGAPSAEQDSLIREIHAFYDREYPHLLEAFNARRSAALAAAASGEGKVSSGDIIVRSRMLTPEEIGDIGASR